MDQDQATRIANLRRHVANIWRAMNDEERKRWQENGLLPPAALRHAMVSGYEADEVRETLASILEVQKLVDGRWVKIATASA